jgi:cytochrome P450
MDSIWSKARRLVEERRARGDRRQSIADNLIDEYTAKGYPYTQHAFDMLLGELVEGGAETTSSSILTVLLALARKPEIQAKARKEIDAVCGAERCVLREHTCHWRP